jgi:hypothetical protein
VRPKFYTNTENNWSWTILSHLSFTWYLSLVKENHRVKVQRKFPFLKNLSPSIFRGLNRNHFCLIFFLNITMIIKFIVLPNASYMWTRIKQQHSFVAGPPECESCFPSCYPGQVFVCTSVALPVKCGQLWLFLHSIVPGMWLTQERKILKGVSSTT